MAGRNDACAFSSISCASSMIRRSPCWPRPPFRVRARNLILPPFVRIICSRPSAVLMSFTYLMIFGPSKNSRISSKVSVAVFWRWAVYITSSPYISIPHVARPWSRSVFPFCLGTDPPQVEHDHLPDGEKLIQSSRTSTCHGSSVKPPTFKSFAARKPSLLS